ncbi:MAG: GTP 3',8-cyclase MoaA [Holophagaceae bacterium]|jgi:cyclic pyranopterin phosphate synthase|nr:GTP 3',8-cyclase MoaA [Acidobacteriota bacterium]
MIQDRIGRPLTALRVSVIDRCNLRCTYCMPADVFNKNYTYLKSNEILTFDEIQQVVQSAMQVGVRKIRLTGGEPLLRPNLSELVKKIKSVGIDEIALTTNGLLLDEHAETLYDAGLDRVTISLDTLSPSIFQKMSGTSVSIQKVFSGIRAAQKTGFLSIKVNAVIQRGMNDGEILPLAHFARTEGIHLRFIEFMDVGHTNQWSKDQVVSGREILEVLKSRWDLVPIPPKKNHVAQDWIYEDGLGKVGFINSVSEAFCGGCDRGRLTADGIFYTCLFSAKGHDLKRALRESYDADLLTQILKSQWSEREDRYSELRADKNEQPRMEMSRIGG